MTLNYSHAYDMRVPETAPAPEVPMVTTYKGHNVERIDCTLHAAHAGQGAYIRKGGKAMSPAQICKNIHLARSPLARAASIQRMGPWSADVVERP